MAGKSLPCPKCKERIRVPSQGPAPTGSLAPQSSKPEQLSDGPPPSIFDSDDPFQLAAPAIDNLSERDETARQIREEKERKRAEVRRKQAARQTPTAKQPPEIAVRNPQADAASIEAPIPFDSDEELNTNTVAKPEPVADSQAKQESTAAGASSSEELASTETVDAKRSIFDDDLPELADLASEEPRRVTLPPMETSLGADTSAGAKPNSGRTPTSPPQVDELGDLDDLVPDLPGAAPLADLHEEEVLEDAQYRITCKTCGTSQYVAPSARGMKIKCPDCFIEFKVPPPPKDWKAKQAKKPKPNKLSADDDIALAAQDGMRPAAESEKRRERTQEILDKAEAEISEDEEEQRYDYDFDTASFVQRTFGFLRDPLALVQILGYGIVFGCIFGLTQFSLNDVESMFGRGMLLISMILIPVIGMLFALPMLSGGLGLIEAAANKQKYIREIPVFSLFDNFADVLVIAFALAGAIIPGYLGGFLLSGEGSGTYLKLGGMMATGFLLFPFFLLSMLDNGSLFAPVSSSVIRSLTAAAESWAGYYMKTLVACFATLVLWFMLLGGNPYLAGIAGFTLPLLLFFICQQIGGLADGIGDHLSFEFTPEDNDESDDLDA